eukprot:COSAG05_NODE_18068_length_314_cov_0.958140_1_plen_46_part_10
MVVAWSSPDRGHSHLQEPHGKPEWPQLEAASTGSCNMSTTAVAAPA